MRYKYIETSRTPSGKFFNTTNFTAAGGTGASPGTITGDRWPPGGIPPSKWCVKDTTIWGSIECIPPEPPPEPPSGSRRQAISEPPPPEMKIKLDLEWKVECNCVDVNLNSEGEPWSQYDTPPDGKVTGGHCKKGKRNFHFFHNSYAHNCRPVTGGGSTGAVDGSVTRWVTTTEKGCRCLMPVGGYGSHLGKCRDKFTTTIDLLNPNYALFKRGDKWHSNGAEATWNPGVHTDLDAPPSDPSMKAALEKCGVKKIPISGGGFYYKLEDYDDGSRSSQDQIDCLNNLICCEEGEEDTGESTSLLVSSIIKKLMSQRVLWMAGVWNAICVGGPGAQPV